MFQYVLCFRRRGHRVLLHSRAHSNFSATETNNIRSMIRLRQVAEAEAARVDGEAAGMADRDILKAAAEDKE